MRDKICLKTIYRCGRNNAGYTLIEMIVSFLMLAIFLVAASTVIVNTSGQYYQVKGETYGKQVSDIVMNKVKSEIEGAKADGDMIIFGDDVDKTGAEKITLYDRTNTKVDIYAKDGCLEIKYYGYKDEKTGKKINDNVWKFDKKFYNGYTLDKISFIKASALSDSSNAATVAEHNIDTSAVYGDDIVLVLMDFSSARYGTYKSHRFIKVYEMESGESGPSNP